MPSVGPEPPFSGIGPIQQPGPSFRPGWKRKTVNLTANKALTGLFAMRRDVWVNESPIYLTAGDSAPYAITLEQASAISNTSAKIYKGGTDYTSTYMSGATSVSGNVVTLPTIGSPNALVGGERYVAELTATVDGIVTIKACMFIVRLNGSEAA